MKKLIRMVSLLSAKAASNKPFCEIIASLCIFPPIYSSCFDLTKRLIHAWKETVSLGELTWGEGSVHVFCRILAVHPYSERLGASSSFREYLAQFSLFTDHWLLWERNCFLQPFPLKIAKFLRRNFFTETFSFAFRTNTICKGHVVSLVAALGREKWAVGPRCTVKAQLS